MSFNEISLFTSLSQTRFSGDLITVSDTFRGKKQQILKSFLMYWRKYDRTKKKKKNQKASIVQNKKLGRFSPV